MSTETQKKNILFYFDGLRSQAMYMVALQLQSLGNNIKFCTTDLTWTKAAKLKEEKIRIFLTNNQDIRNFTDVDIFVTDDIKARYCPNEALSVCIPHSLIEKPENNFPKFEFWQKFYLSVDFLFQANRLNMDDINPEKFSRLFSQSYPKEFIEYRKPNLYVVPAGYAKLDLLKKNCNYSPR